MTWTKKKRRKKRRARWARMAITWMRKKKKTTRNDPAFGAWHLSWAPCHQTKEEHFCNESLERNPFCVRVSAAPHGCGDSRGDSGGSCEFRRPSAGLVIEDRHIEQEEIQPHQ